MIMQIVMLIGVVSIVFTLGYLLGFLIAENLWMKFYENQILNIFKSLDFIIIGKPSYYDGIISNIKIYNRALTANEIKEEYDK